MAKPLEILTLFREAVSKRASDIHLKPGRPPYLRIDGILQPAPEYEVLTDDDLDRALQVLLEGRSRDALEQHRVYDFAVSIEGLARFRINAYYQMGHLAMAVRVIPITVKTIRELNLPRKVEELAMEDHGLILVTGVAGTGKSTTLAAMIDHINHRKAVNIITIEDPIEYVIPEDRALISQREVGFDTTSFYAGLREALRQDPNVIMIGEMRDRETIETALIAAETGHLVISTLHTMDAKETINRIVSVFPASQQHQIRVQLAMVLKATISQRLVPRKDGQGRVPAVEIMVNNARVRDLILEPGRVGELTTVIAESYVPYGMQTFDQSLYYLWRRGLIDEETLYAYSTQPDILRLKVQGVTGGVEGDTWQYFDDLARKDQLRELEETGTEP